MVADVKSFPGDFRVLPLAGRTVSMRLDGATIPDQRHGTQTEAITEARKLSAHFPGTTFLVIREVARVKHIDSSTEGTA
ncbi:hypothetical protein HMP06_0498 [Sphingomonas sp. HMP6]|nr:hypothetical protein HMP06_0498 [Sphingomonas sp. HMP6]